MIEIIVALLGLAGIFASLLAWPAALGILVWTLLRRVQVARRLVAACTLVLLPFFIGNASGNLWSLGSDYPEFYIPEESSVFAFSVLEGSGGSGQWWTYAKDGKNVYFNNQDGTYVISSLVSAVNCRKFHETKIETWCARRSGRRNGAWL